MKKRVIPIMLAVVAMVILPVGVVAAQETTIHEINFDINGKYKTQDYYSWTSPSVTVDANATFSGELRQKNGSWYFLPSPLMKGNITIGGEQHEIVVKQLYHPPHFNYHLHYDNPAPYNNKSEEWYYRVEVDIEGDKYTGWLWFWVISDKVDGKLIQSGGQSQLYFEGIRADGKIVTFYTVGAPPPVIE